MSFRGRGGGGFGRGGGFRGGRGGGGFRGRGGGFDRGGRSFDNTPPDKVTPLGSFQWTVQDDLVAKAEIEDVPFFNAPIYNENKQQIGKIDEIFGNVKDYYVSIKLSENIRASSFEKNTKLYIDPAKLLPLQRFLPKPPGEKKKTRRGMKRGGAGGAGGSGGAGGAGGGGGGGQGSGGGRRPSFGRGGFSNKGGAFRNSGGGGSGFKIRGGGGFKGRGRGRR